MNLDGEIIKQIKITPLLDTLKLEDIDDDVYFKQYSKEYISNSRLGVLKRDGVKTFFEGIPQVYNPSFETGTLIHENVLEPEKYEVIEGVFKPTAKAGLMADALYKSDGTTPTDDEIKSMSYKIGYYKDKLTSNRLKEFRDKAEPYWRDRFLFEQNNPLGEKKRIFTDEKNYNLLVNCLKTLNENKDIQKLLHPSGLVEEPIVGNERTILMDIEMKVPDYEPRIYHLKAKLDNFSIDSEEKIITVNDLKTTSRPAVQFDPTFFSYQREIAFYSWLIKLCAKKFYNVENATTKGNFLVVSTIPEYNTLVYPMTPKLFLSGWKEVLYLLKTVAYFNQVKGYEFTI
ncbi:MAG: hypothetical protein VZS44_07455 [Bacilli bacterium]|nr:hypothetical protein [Bacilli bacterium]